MLKAILILSIIITAFLYPEKVCSQTQDNRHLKELMNSMVGGTWESTNDENTGKPEEFKSYFMEFKNWHDGNSVRGSIYGIKNNSDTTSLIEVWNFIDKANKNIRLIQRTTWQEHSEGTITPYQGKHLDIRFTSTTADGQTYFTRDIHFVESPNRLRAVSYHRRTEVEKWQKAGESVWIRTVDNE